MHRILVGLAAGFVLILMVLPSANVTPTYPAESIDNNIQWSANDCFNYSASITMDNTSHALSTTKGYFTVLFEDLFPSNSTATLRIEQNVAYKGANPSYVINVPIQRISSYLPYIMISNLSKISRIKAFLNNSYGSSLYSISIQPMENEIMDRSLWTCEVSLNSPNTSGRIYLDLFNGLIVEGSVSCKFTDLNLQNNVERTSTLVLEKTNVPMNSSLNPGGPFLEGSYPSFLIYFYYFTMGALAFLIGIAIIWLLRNVRR